MMRPCSPLIVFLLVLHLLLSGAYGARLGIFSFKSLIHTVQQTQSTFLGNTNSNYNDAVKKHGVDDQDVSVREKIEVVCEDEDHCASKGTLLIKRRMSRVAKESDHDHDQHHHHWFPWIYEDYRGPKRHIPRHH